MLTGIYSLEILFKSIISFLAFHYYLEILTPSTPPGEEENEYHMKIAEQSEDSHYWGKKSQNIC